MCLAAVDAHLVQFGCDPSASSSCVPSDRGRVLFVEAATAVQSKASPPSNADDESPPDKVYIRQYLPYDCYTTVAAKDDVPRESDDSSLAQFPDANWDLNPKYRCVPDGHLPVYYDPYLQNALFICCQPCRDEQADSTTSEQEDGCHGIGYTEEDDTFSAPTPAVYVWHTFKPNAVTFHDVIRYPIYQYHAHGPFFNGQSSTKWVFFGVFMGTATVTVAFSRLSAYRALLQYAIAVFLAVGSEKLYHAILAANRFNRDAGAIAYAVGFIIVVIEGVPLLFSALFLLRARARPIPWAILGLVLSAGFLFLGAGWYVGVGLLFLASLFVLAGRLL